MTKVLIFGTGGVGCIYAYVCHKGGAEVTVVCRSNYDAVKEHGITIESKIWGTVQFQPKVVKNVADGEGPFDFIIVCSKAFTGIAALIKDAVSPKTAIVLAQNGIAIEEDWHDYLANTIISGAVYLPTTQTKPGYVVHGPLEIFEIGTYPSNANAAAKARVQELSDLFAAAGAHAPVYDDIQQRRWIKLAVNAAWNPVTAITMCDDANFLTSSADAEGVIMKIFKEVARVAAAAGYPDLITDEEIDRQMERSRERAKNGGKEPSMLTDVRNGRPIEVEAILGNTVKIARAFGVEVNYLDLLYVLAKARDFQLSPGERWLPLAM